MSAWGAGLYASDYALDLKPMIGALCRLPHDAAAIVRLLTELDPAANDPDNEDHTIFWLVLADQLWKRGVAADTAFARARAIIASGADLAAMRSLGMEAAELAKRGKMLAALDAQLASPAPAKKRATLARPQPLIMSAGEVLAYPTARGQSRNPYMAPGAETAAGRVEDGEGAAIVVAAGHAFGYLAWYAIWPVAAGLAAGPMTMAAALASPLVGRWDAGTCSRAHYQRIGLRRLGEIDPPILGDEDRAAVEAHGRIMAVNDISIANALSFRLDPTRAENAMSLADYAAGR